MGHRYAGPNGGEPNGLSPGRRGPDGSGSGPGRAEDGSGPGPEQVPVPPAPRFPPSPPHPSLIGAYAHAHALIRKGTTHSPSGAPRRQLQGPLSDALCATRLYLHPPSMSTHIRLIFASARRSLRGTLVSRPASNDAAILPLPVPHRRVRTYSHPQAAPHSPVGSGGYTHIRIRKRRPTHPRRPSPPASRRARSRPAMRLWPRATGRAHHTHTRTHTRTRARTHTRHAHVAPARPPAHGLARLTHARTRPRAPSPR